MSLRDYLPIQIPLYRILHLNFTSQPFLILSVASDNIREKRLYFIEKRINRKSAISPFLFIALIVFYIPTFASDNNHLK